MTIEEKMKKMEQQRCYKCQYGRDMHNNKEYLCNKQNEIHPMNDGRNCDFYEKLRVK